MESVDDPVLKLLVGPVSEAYKDNGYKNRTLGVSFDDLNKEGVLGFLSPETPVIIRNKPIKPDEEFVFDSEKVLIMYVKGYDGGSKDYLNQLVAVFGKTDKQFITHWSKNRNEVTTAFYHFPKVFVKLLFVTTLERSNGGSVTKVERTYVAVLNKSWVMRVLNKNIKDKRNNFKWLQKVTESAQEETIDTAKWPALEGSRMREVKSARNVLLGHMFVDVEHEGG